MPNPTRVIIDCSTGDISEVELTTEEMVQMAAEHDAFVAQQEAQAQTEADALAAKVSAEGKLKALGLSDAEIAALLN